MGGKEVTTETRTYEPDQDALARAKTFMEQYLPGAVGKILYTKSCLYTSHRTVTLSSMPCRKIATASSPSEQDTPTSSHPLSAKSSANWPSTAQHRATSKRSASTAPSSANPIRQNTSWCEPQSVP